MNSSPIEELDTAQLQTLKAALENLRDEIHRQLEDNASASAPVELDQTLVGRVSRVDAMQQQGIALNNRQQLLQRQKKVAMALRAIADGDYGYCQHCDEAIGFARLQVQPEANLCLRCQENADEH